MKKKEIEPFKLFKTKLLQYWKSFTKTENLILDEWIKKMDYVNLDYSAELELIRLTRKKTIEEILTKMEQMNKQTKRPYNLTYRELWTQLDSELKDVKEC